MKVSYHWLKELIPDLTASPTEVAELLTLHSFETTITGHFAVDENVTVAQITKLAPHPNADRLRLATVTTGVEEVQVVCGASNIAEGDIVPFSPPGTRLYDEAKQPFTLTAAVIRGEPSPGMLNSPRELGLGETHAGIYLLPADTPVGSRLAEHIPADTILEAEITPNRAHDCLSHLGLAREVAGLLGLTVLAPSQQELPTTPLADWQLKVADDRDVPRYLGVVITGVSVQPSPLWLQARLWALGARPINNLVDITNYVLFEVGNPTHLFDADTLPSTSIGVRAGRAAEHLTTLDGVDRTFASPDTSLVITSGDTPVALAGIMGGSTTEVSEKTTTVLLEAANFRAYLIQQAMAAVRLRSESAVRFSKGLSPELAGQAAGRVLALLGQYAGGTVQGMMEQYPHPPQPRVIALHPAAVSTVAGYAISKDEIQQALTALRFGVRTADATTWEVTVPLDRLDVMGEHDVVEEVVRVRGLSNIPTIPIRPQPSRPLPLQVQLREYCRDHFVAAGFTEVYNRPFEHVRIAQVLALATTDAIRLANPVAPEQSVLRVSLLPRLLDALLTNKGEVRRRRAHGSRNLFEVSTVWHQGGGGKVPGVREEEYVAGVMVDGETARDVVVSLLRALGAGEEASTDIWRTGTLDRATTDQLKLPPQIQFFEINLDQLLPLVADDFSYTVPDTRASTRYQPQSKFPATIRDISLLVDPNISVEQVQGVIERVGGTLLADVDLFDEYQPAPEAAADTASPPKGLAFHLTYQSHERTLSGSEVAALHNRIVATLKEELGVSVRE